MKKIIISVLLFVSLHSFSQTIVNRAGAANTVSDSRWQAALNAFLPRYNDTSAATAAKGIDSAGAIIYTRDVNGLWYRQNNPKKWVRIPYDVATSITNISIVNVTDSSVNIQICTGAGASCDTVTVNNITIDNPTTVELIGNDTIVVCNEFAECDTAVISPQQFAYFFQNILTQISPGIVEFGGEMLHTTTATYNGEELLNLYTNRDIGIPNYPNSRIDPAVTNILGTNSLGVIQSYPYINPIRYGLVSGGAVVWIEDYDYHVSPATYFINGAPYTSPDTTVTLAAADATYDRIDAFVVNEDGEVEVITGTPSADPQQPSVDPATQLLLTFALVTAATTAPPDIESECIYQENTEWTATSSSVRINVNSTNTPCAGAKTVEGTAVVNGDFVTFTRGTAFDPRTDHNTLTFQIKSKGNWGNNNSNRRLVIGWRDGSNIIGQQIIISNGSYGFVASNTTDCQTISISLGAFFLPSTASITQLRITALTSNGSFGWYIDNICLQGGGGTTPPPVTTGITSIGSLPPLFQTTTSAAGATTFTQIPQGANEVFIGPASGADAFPSFRSLVPADIPTDLHYYRTMEQIDDTSIALIRGDLTRDTISVSPNTFEIANTVFVAKNGDDATGQRERIDLPFLTINAAVAAAAAGDVVVVYPGVYEELTRLKTETGVNYWFVGNGEVKLITSNTTDPVVGLTGGSIAATSVIYAPGWKFTARTSQRVFSQYNSSSSTRFVFKVLQCSSGLPTIELFAGKVELAGDTLINTGTGQALYYDGSTVVVTATIEHIESTQNNAILGDEGSIKLKAKSIVKNHVSNADYLVYLLPATASSVYIEAELLYTQLGWAYYVQGSSLNCYLKAQRIQAGGTCTVVSGSSGMSYVEAQEIANHRNTNPYGLIHAEGGNITVMGARLVRLGAGGGYDVKTSVSGPNQGTVKLIAVSYNKDLISESAPFTIRRIDNHFQGNLTIYDGRFMGDKGADVVAANNLTLGSDGNLFTITGATQINAIDTSGWLANSVVRFIFSGAPTVKHNTAGGAGTVPILLAGSADFVAGANDVLTLVFEGTYWRETSRQIAGTGGGTIAANNGITLTGSTVQLGSLTNSGVPLTASRFINTSTFTLTAEGSGSTVFYGNNTGSGTGVRGQSPSGFAVYGVTTTGVGGQFNASDAGAFGLQAYNSAGVAANFTSTYASTNDVQIVAAIGRNSSGTAASGIGGSLDFGLATTTTANSVVSNRLISKWTDATNATRTSQFEVWGVNSGTTAKKMSIAGSGQLTLDTYGSGTHTGTATKWLAVTSAGAVIEEAIPGGASYTGDNGLTLTSTNFQLGGTLIQNTTINTSTFLLKAEGTNSTVFYGNNTSSGTGVRGQSVSGIGMQGYSETGLAANFDSYNIASANTVSPVLTVRRGTSGTAASGIGLSADFYLEMSDGSSAISNQIVSKWTTATSGSQLSQLIITGVNGGVTVDRLVIGGEGYVKLTPITATAASAITPAEGMLLFASSTDATFTSIGLWCYENGAWSKK